MHNVSYTEKDKVKKPWQKLLSFMNRLEHGEDGNDEIRLTGTARLACRWESKHLHSPTQTEGSDKPSSVNFILSMGRPRRARAERSSGKCYYELLLASLDSYSGHCRAAGYPSYIVNVVAECPLYICSPNTSLHRCSACWPDIITWRNHNLWHGVCYVGAVP
ncbi:hypothetical protein B0H13DRAFT_1884928 [Mycena leptocephala]|nr:hypothetical protein B0H13DRAFT_1884928 [Mycena leptocephala]